MLRPTRSLTILAALSILFLGAACNTSKESDSVSSVKWDLRNSHTKSDVKWASTSKHTWEIPDADYDITLKGGMRLTGKHMLRLNADSDTDSDRLDSLHIIYPNMTTDDVYRAAIALAKELALPTTNLERWYKQRTEGRAAGHEEINSTTGMSPTHHEAGTPELDVSLYYSFDHEKPTFIDLSLFWPKSEE